MTGQADFSSPQLIAENGVSKMSPQQIAQSLNRQFLQKKIKNKKLNETN